MTQALNSILVVLWINWAGSIAPAKVIIRVVDRSFNALTGIPVVIQQRTTCGTPFQANGNPVRGETQDQGLVELSFAETGFYDVRVGGNAGFDRATDCIYLKATQAYGAAYLQMQLRLDPSHPISVSGSEIRGRTGNALDLVDYCGLYKTNDGHFYEVTSLAGARGLVVDPPDDRVLFFPERHGDSFVGSSGTLRFNVSKRRVVGFVIEHGDTRASRVR
jgi:hypothetical protein